VFVVYLSCTENRPNVMCIAYYIYLVKHMRINSGVMRYFLHVRDATKLTISTHTYIRGVKRFTCVMCRKAFSRGLRRTDYIVVLLVTNIDIVCDLSGNKVCHASYKN